MDPTPPQIVISESGMRGQGTVASYEGVSSFDVCVKGAGSMIHLDSQQACFLSLSGNSGCCHRMWAAILVVLLPQPGTEHLQRQCPSQVLNGNGLLAASSRAICDESPWLFPAQCCAIWKLTYNNPGRTQTYSKSFLGHVPNRTLEKVGRWGLPRAGSRGASIIHYTIIRVPLNRTAPIWICTYLLPPPPPPLFLLHPTQTIQLPPPPLPPPPSQSTKSKRLFTASTLFFSLSLSPSSDDDSVLPPLLYWVSNHIHYSETHHFPIPSPHSPDILLSSLLDINLC